RRLGHLLKTVTRTTRKLESQPGQDPEFVQDYRIQLHSPVQAASILARLVGLNRRTWDLQTGHVPAEDSQPDSPHHDSPKQDSDSAEPSIDYHQSPQDDLPNSVPAEHFALAQSDPPGLVNNGSDDQSTKPDSLPPIPKDIRSDKGTNLPPAASQTSTASP